MSITFQYFYFMSNIFIEWCFRSEAVFYRLVRIRVSYFPKKPVVIFREKTDSNFWRIKINTLLIVIQIELNRYKNTGIESEREIYLNEFRIWNSFRTCALSSELTWISSSFSHIFPMNYTKLWENSIGRYE